MAMQVESNLGDITAPPTAVGLAARLAVAELQRRNIDPAPLLARCRISAVALASRKRISVSSQVRFLELAAEAVGDDWIGLTLAETVDLRELGMLYYVAASSPGLGDALRRLERYARVGNEALIIKLRKGGACSIGFAYAGISRHLDRHQIELLMAGLLRLCRHLVGQRLMPRFVHFVHHRSDDLQRIRGLFGGEVQFDAGTDEISFDAVVAELPLVDEDPYLNELMVAACEAAMAGRPSNVSPLRTTVENIVAPLLPHAEANAKVVAKKLGLSERTFARRLAAERLSFGGILDDLRRDLAARYLEEPNLQVSQMAWLLGFHQPSAFSHACHRWFRKSPSA